MSTFEFAKLVDISHYPGTKSQAAVTDSRTGCDKKDYHDVWQAYIKGTTYKVLSFTVKKDFRNLDIQ